MTQIAAQSTGPAPQDELRRWGINPAGGPASSTGQALLGALDHALQTLSHRETARIETSMGRPPRRDRVRELRFLACRVFTTTTHNLRWTGRADQALTWLCSDSRNLDLGWVNSPLWASRDLLAAATRYCSPAQLDAAAAALLDYYPWWESSESADHLPARGRAQRQLLSAIPADRCPSIVMERIAELDVGAQTTYLSTRDAANPGGRPADPSPNNSPNSTISNGEPRSTSTPPTHRVRGTPSTAVPGHSPASSPNVHGSSPTASRDWP